MTFVYIYDRILLGQIHLVFQVPIQDRRDLTYSQPLNIRPKKPGLEFAMVQHFPNRGGQRNFGGNRNQGTGGRGVPQQPKPQATNEPIKLGKPLGSGQVKFTMYDGPLAQRLLDFGIKERDRSTPEANAAKQKRWYDVIGDPSFGYTVKQDRLRPGHVDAGTLRFEEDWAQCGLARRGLREAGYGLTDMWAERAPGDPKDRITFSATFRLLKEGEKSIALPTGYQEGLQEVSADHAWMLYAYYNNPDVEEWIYSLLGGGFDYMALPLPELRAMLLEKAGGKIDPATMDTNFTVNFTKPRAFYGATGNPTGIKFNGVCQIKHGMIVYNTFEQNPQAQGQGITATDEGLDASALDRIGQAGWAVDETAVPEV